MHTCVCAWEWVRLCVCMCVWVHVSACACVCCWDWTQDFVCAEYWAIFYLQEATVSFSVSVYLGKILNLEQKKNSNLMWETYVGPQKSPKLHETVGWFWCKYILIFRASFLGWKPLDCTKVSKTFRSRRDYFRLLKLLIVTLTRIQRVIHIDTYVPYITCLSSVHVLYHCDT